MIRMCVSVRDGAVEWGELRLYKPTQGTLPIPVSKRTAAVSLTFRNHPVILEMAD
jgi:hypothetical protein